MAISFSVIVPVYNKGKYLKSCIDSILSQKNADLEILAINDGSTDDSLAILRAYEDARLKIIDVKNGGVSAARNLGINHSTKDYIAFVDGDDCLGSSYLSNFAKAIEKSGADIIIGGLTKTDRYNERREVKPSFAVGAVSSKKFLDSYYAEMLSNEGILGYVASKVVKRTILGEGIRFDTTLKLAEDLDFWARVYIKVKTIEITDECGYFYLTGTDNSSVNLTGQQITQLAIWNTILSTYPRTDKKAYSQILKKMNGIMEAHFLEMETMSLHKVKEGLKSEFRYVEPFLEDLRINTYGYLQKQIIKRRAMTILSYLQVRKLYHILRRWLH